MIAAMKGELRVARGDSGGLAAPGGGEEGAQGEGWARLPERTYSLGAATRTQPGLRDHRSVATGVRGRDRPASSRGKQDSRAHSPLRRLHSRCHSPGCAWHPAGLPKESLLRVAALGTRREDLATGRKLGTATLGPQGPHPGAALAYVGGRSGGQAGPCMQTLVVSSPGLNSVPGLASEPRMATPLCAARSARVASGLGKCRSSALRPLDSATSESARAGANPAPQKVPRRPRSLPRPLRARARHLVHGCRETTGAAHRIGGQRPRLDRGEGLRAQVSRGQASKPRAFLP